MASQTIGQRLEIFNQQMARLHADSTDLAQILAGMNLGARAGGSQSLGSALLSLVGRVSAAAETMQSIVGLAVAIEKLEEASRTTTVVAPTGPTIRITKPKAPPAAKPRFDQRIRFVIPTRKP